MADNIKQAKKLKQIGMREKDFKVVCGPYLSIRNIEHLKSTYSSVWLDLITVVVRVV
jgi:hypothetical protein